jgi:uncharacterized protein YjbJ (UPF0337 family)
MSDFKDESTKEEFKGKSDKAKGTLKEGAGKVTGREDWEAEGKADQAEGGVREGLGKAGRKISDTAESAADKVTGKD